MEKLGSFESSGNYSAVGPPTGVLGNGLGRYQIMSSNWASWAREAGIPGADWRDPVAQDKVAAYKLTQYYNQFGSWDMVAVAWFAGPGNAAEAVSQGLDSVGRLRDILGTTVTKYVEATAGQLEQREAEQPGPRFDSRGVDTRKLLAGVFSTISNTIAGGQRQLPPLHRATPRPIEDTPQEFQTGRLETEQQIVGENTPIEEEVNSQTEGPI
jgi:hypothetical protein